MLQPTQWKANKTNTALINGDQILLVPYTATEVLDLLQDEEGLDDVFDVVWEDRLTKLKSLSIAAGGVWAVILVMILTLYWRAGYTPLLALGFIWAIVPTFILIAEKQLQRLFHHYFSQGCMDEVEKTFLEECRNPFGPQSTIPPELHSQIIAELPSRVRDNIWEALPAGSTPDQELVDRTLTALIKTDAAKVKAS